MTNKQNGFTPPIIHSKYLAQKSDLLLSPSVHKVVVLGGAKSAFDTVQMLIKGGKHVTWIIREDRTGPACMANPKPPPIFGLKNSSALISTRFVSKLSPSIFEPVDGWARFWHKSKIGIVMSTFFWKMINIKWWKSAGYDKDERLLPLKPDRSVYYVHTLGIANAPDIWSTVAKAEIVRGGIDGLSRNEVILKSGRSVTCDALVACTGWDARSGIFSTEQSAELGLPVGLMDESASDSKLWESLIAEADMNGRLPLKTEEEMDNDLALVIAWRRRRYLGDGHFYLFDGHEYCSQLLRDLGINDARKSGWRELFSPYDVQDYRGLIEEWKAVDTKPERP